MFRQSIVWTLVIGFVALGGLTAQEANKAAPPAQALKVTVVSVTGVAHKRSTAVADGKWEPLKPGEVLSDQLLIRTGLGTKVVLKLGDRGEVTVRSGTKIGIGELSKRGKTMKARLGLKYGSIRASVDSAAGPNDLRVASPVATLSVRGSAANMAMTENGVFFCVPEHRWEYFLPNRRRKLVREKECGNDRGESWYRLTHRADYVPIRDPGNGQTDEDHLAQIYDSGGGSVFNGGAFGGFLGLFGHDDSGRNGYDNGYDNGYINGYDNGYDAWDKRTDWE